MSMAGGSVYVATVDLPFTVPKMSYPLGTPDGNGTGEIVALNLATGHVEWDTKVPAMPFGATTVSNDLVVTTLYNSELIALNRSTGAIVYRHSLPASTNAPIAIAGNAIVVPAGGSTVFGAKGGSPQLVTYTVP
jgi:outer membrane protein assembly factor BamB